MPGIAMSRIRHSVRFTQSEARNSSAEEKARASKPNSLSKILANRFAIESGELADRLHAEPLPLQLFDVTHVFPLNRSRQPLSGATGILRPA